MDEKKTSAERIDKDEEVFITDITINKVRHLQDIHIPLSGKERKHLILTGKNGSGKTSVLEYLKMSLRIILKHEMFDNVDYKEYKDYQAQGKGISISFNSLARFRSYSLSGHFPIALYGAKREVEMIISKGLKKVDLKEYYKIDEYPGKDFIQYIVNLRAEKSFANDEKDYNSVKNIENWFELFENSLKEIFEDPLLRLEFDRKNFNFKIIQQEKEPFDFNTLADGYSAVMNVVTDLILRMEKHKTTSYDTQGLVLIDELETHLHIDLQKKIFPFLTRFFPRVQFIVTTHSPFILNSMDNAVIYDLEKNLLVEDLSGYSYDGIVESYFDNDKYSETVKTRLERFEQLVGQSKRTDSEEVQMIELRDYLKGVPNALAPELKAKFQQVELNRIGKHQQQ